jgi:hypothetical protein
MSFDDRSNPHKGIGREGPVTMGEFRKDPLIATIADHEGISAKWGL